MAERLADYEQLQSAPWAHYSADGLRSLLTWLAVDWFWGDGTLVDASASDFVFNVLSDATELRRLHRGTDIRKNTRKIDISRSSVDVLPVVGVGVEVLVLSGDGQVAHSERFVRQIAEVLILGRSLVLIMCSQSEQAEFSENWGGLRLLESFDYGVLLGTSAPKLASNSNCQSESTELVSTSARSGISMFNASGFNASGSNLQIANVVGLHRALQTAQAEIFTQMEILVDSENSLVTRVGELQKLLIQREGEIRAINRTHSALLSDTDSFRRDLQHSEEVILSLRETVQKYEAAYEELRAEVELLKVEKKELWDWCSSAQESAAEEADASTFESDILDYSPRSRGSRVLRRLVGR